tara:strand:- start:20207 stop:21991 length:1785 start_codon:yes stop_codon:yes gene_type:complete
MNSKKESIPLLIKGIWSYFENKRKKQIIYLFILTVFTSFAEILSLGALLPFLASLTNPERLFELSFLKPFFSYLNITSPKNLVLPFTILFCIAAVFSGCMRLLQTLANIRVSYDTGADLSIEVYKRTLYQSYETHVSRNSSVVINAVSSKTMAVISAGILPVITILTSLFVIASIMTTLLIIDPIIASTAFIGFGLIYIFIISLTRKKLNDNGQLIANESNQVIKSLQEGLGGIRDVIIDNSQEIYKEIYQRAIFPLRRAQGNNLFIAQSPRFIIESLGMVLIAILAYWIVEGSGNFIEAIPAIGVLAFGAQRMLPIFQQIYAAISTIRGSKASLIDVMTLLDQKINNFDFNSNINFSFKDKIELKNLKFQYLSNKPIVLKNINIKILRGSKVGIIGETGCGKSTLLDIIMGLLSPSEGYVKIDEIKLENNKRAWQSNIAHVPQSIFLSDSTIEKNISFGSNQKKLDKKRIAWAAKLAQIHDTIIKWPNKYKTNVGERGVKLSGGQRQRIGIARALYKKANLIVLDEATSALDLHTEDKVMNAINNINDNPTIIIVAHRLSTLRNCDEILEIKNGLVSKITNINQISNSFLTKN